MKPEERKFCGQWSEEGEAKKVYGGDILYITASVYKPWAIRIGNKDHLSKYSAYACLVLKHGGPGYTAETILKTMSFTADTEKEIKLFIEDWAQGQFYNINKLVSEFYGEKKE